MKNIYYYESCIGNIGIAEEEGKITNILFENEKLNNTFVIKEIEIIKKAHDEIEEYFLGKRKGFTIEINPKGTDFMKSVWKELCNIPYGKTVSYKDIAMAIGNEKAARAVGMANNKNPIPIFIPCHRVIGKNGQLVGYSGGVDIKHKLLEIEKNNN